MGEALARWGGRVVLAAFVGVGFSVTLAVPWAQTDRLPLALVVGAALAASFAWFARVARDGPAPGSAPTAAAPRRTLALLVVLGLSIRAAFVATVPPEQYGDFAAYLDSARGLLADGTLRFAYAEHSLHAFRAPGVPLLYAGAFSTLGDHALTPFVVNSALFVITALGAYRLAAYVVPEPVPGLLAVGLLVLWPSYVAHAGAAASEGVSMALLVAASLATASAVRTGRRRYAILAGVVTGLGALVRPALMLYPSVWLALVVLAAGHRRECLRLLVLGTACLVLTVAPYSVRNYFALDAFVPISTNGGSVLYRANNPHASGNWTVRGERDLDALLPDEVAWNRTGTRWALEWIAVNPGDFATLSLRKVALMFQGDWRFLAYTVGRHDGVRATGFVLAKRGADAYWVAAWALIVAACYRLRATFVRHPIALLLCLNVLFTVSLHAVFESNMRHHMPFLPCLAILASMIAARAPAPP